MTTREEAAAQAMVMTSVRTQTTESMELAQAALAAADAHDLAHGVHRLTIDDATVERAARGMNSQFTLQWEKMPEWVREDERRIVRCVLAAAVKEEQA